MDTDYINILQRACDKYRKHLHSAADRNILPYGSDASGWTTSPFDGNSWWTGGFWPGLMWQLYAASHDPVFHEEALRAEELLTRELRTFRYLNHDVGFMYLLSCGAHYRMDGDVQARLDTLHAASLLMGRFNPAGFIRAWNEPEHVGFAIIDCMMNLSLLFVATRLTGDPRFSAVARIHADTTLREFIRDDGSVSHIIEFDPVTGEALREHPGQGYGPGSSWSRGQAWGLHGFALCHRNTRDPRYLKAARKIAGYVISNIRPDGLTNCDFRQPEKPERLDNIAGAIAACGLLELETAVPGEGYREAALRLVDGLLRHCCDWSDRICGLLTHCTASYHDDAAGFHTNITYGDYFLVEALARLSGTDPGLWT